MQEIYEENCISCANNEPRRQENRDPIQDATPMGEPIRQGTDDLRDAARFTAQATTANRTPWFND